MTPRSPRAGVVAALIVSAAAVAALPGSARAELLAEPITINVTVCLPRPIPILPCPEPPAPGSPQPEPRPAAVTPTTVRYDAELIVVDFKRQTTQKRIADVFRRAGVSRERTLRKLGLYVVRAPEGRRNEALAALMKARVVDEVAREVVVDGLDTTPTDPGWPGQWGLHRAGFPQAWDVTRGSKTVVVAVLDTGVDSAHPELKDALVAGRDVVNGDDEPEDDNGHGTAVAGILAARTNNGTGIAGACWNCLVMPVKVLGAEGTGTTADVAAGIVWAADHGARVINLSLGAPGTTPVLSAAVSYALAKDVVVVAAAGNSSSDRPLYPAASPNVVGVAATNPDDQLYSWSNHGGWVEVAAPGCSAAPWPDDGYVDFCGTSAAAPVVAGLAGLVRSASPQATALQTAEAVESSVQQIAGDVRRGRIDAALALSQVRPVPAASRQTQTFSGRLTKRSRSRTHELVVGSGQLTVILQFDGARRLTLVLRQPGRGAVRVSGRSPLRVSRSVVSGPLALIVQGRRSPASYRLTVSSTAPGGP